MVKSVLWDTSFFIMIVSNKRKKVLKCITTAKIAEKRSSILLSVSMSTKPKLIISVGLNLSPKPMNRGIDFASTAVLLTNTINVRTMKSLISVVKMVWQFIWETNVFL